jgi:hypothetical protein
MTMGLRLLRRGSAPAGRHSRAVPGPIVPGAAATLVAAADHWEDAAPQAPAYADSVGDAAAAIAPVVCIPVAPVLLEVHAPSAPGPGEALDPPDAAATAPDSPAPVTLGFADGAQVDLDADDPRVRTFRAAAAALLETPRG